MALTRGELAGRVGIGIETLRFYERRGLIQEPPRTDSGYRQYPESAILRLRFIQRAKQLGFSLQETAELLSLRVDPETTCADVKRQGEVKIREVEEKITALEDIKKALKRLVSSCKGTGPTSECPILEFLSGEDIG